MKTKLMMAGVLGLGFIFATLTGCKTNSPGVKNYLGTFVAHVDGSPDKVTAAAVKAVTDMQLHHIASRGTKIDGWVTARTAQDDEVEIEIELIADNVSKVTVRVGDAGDKLVSQQIFDSINNNLR